MSRYILIALALLAATGLTSSAPADPSVPVRYYLIMDSAMFSAGDPEKNPRELVLDLEREGDVWGPVYGISRNYNMATHRGAVKSAKIGEGTLELELLTTVTPDKWIKGGQGQYTLKMTRDGHKLSGAFEGVFKDKKVEGKVWGWAMPSKPVVEDFEPLEPQEHPRILFRKSDLPRLREKAKTPFGKAAMKKMEAYFASLFPIVPDRWKPEVLHEWNRRNEVSGPGDAAKVLRRDAVQGFLNYPLEMEPRKGGKTLPRTWQAPGWGYHAGRSGWDEGAFIAQTFAKGRPIHGWNGPNAGTFRLRGLGQNWAVGPTARDRRRFQENVVWLPEAETNESGLGTVTHWDPKKDGSFVVSYDLDEVYGPPEKFVYSKYGLVKLPGKDADAEAAFSGIRSIAVDYSGKSGAPCLLAVVDRIEGEGRKLWLWQTPKAPEECVKPADNGFVITGENGASLRGTFATPGKIEMTAKSRTATFTKAAGHGAGEKTFKVQINAVTVGGGDNAYFFVATVGKGEHPEVKVKGKGLDAVVTVGKQTVRFDGEKIILGK